jgi:hypothetical protein
MLVNFGCFALNLANVNVLFVELMGVMVAIKSTFDRNWIK